MKAVPPGQTFLREAAARQETDTSEILALGRLNRLPGPALGPRDFFALPESHAPLDGDSPPPPVRRLYLPLKVRPLRSEDQAWKGRDLPALLAELRKVGDPRGLFFRACTGAGKTVAGLAAYFECLPPNGHSQLNHRLAGHLPVRLTLRQERHLAPIRQAIAQADGNVDFAITEWVNKQGHCELIERYLVGSMDPGLARLDRAIDAGFEERRRRMEDWLKYGPSLLILVDLNASEDLERRLLAEALVYFQKKWSPLGHRVVVTYRSSVKDRIVDALEVGDQFLHCDLERIDGDQAVQYLADFRRFEAKRSGTVIDAANLRLQQGKLRDLIQRTTGMADRRSGTAGEAVDALVSTPLLMHLATTIDGQALVERVRTIADLFDEVVKAWWQDERERHGEHLRSAAPRLYAEDEGFDLLRVAMVRAALAIFAGGTTRLGPQGEESAKAILNQIWEDPSTNRPNGTSLDWHPPEDDLIKWKSSAYFRKKWKETDWRLSKPEQEALIEHGLLRPDQASYGFLHDSFVYYFVAHSLAAWAHPRRRQTVNAKARNLNPPGPWYAAIARRFADRPARWLYVAEFLRGMIGPGEIAELLKYIVLLPPAKGVPEIVDALTGGEPKGDEGVLDRLRELFSRRRRILFAFPEALRAEVTHYLRDYNTSRDTEKWIGELNANGTTPYLHTEQYRGWQTPPMQEHERAVKCVVAAGAGRVVTGGDDGRVIFWNYRNGTVETLVEHDGAVAGIACTEDGRCIISGGGDGRVWRISDLRRDKSPIMEHGNPVVSVAVGRDGTAASGDADGRVMVCLSSESKGREMRGLKLEDAVSFVIVDGETVYCGSRTGEFRSESPGGGTPKPKYFRSLIRAAQSRGGGSLHLAAGKGIYRMGSGGEPIKLKELKTSASAIAVGGNGSTVAAGDERGGVHLFDGGGHRCLSLKHHGRVYAVAVSRDGNRVVSAGRDGSVIMWQRNPRVEKRIRLHTNGIHAIALSEAGESIATGGGDRDVRLTDLDWTAPAEPTADSAVTRIACSGDASLLALGQTDGQVSILDRARGARTNLHRHRSPVTALAVSVAREGGVVVASGGGRKDPRVLVTRDGIAETLYSHARAVTDICVVRDARMVVSVGEDGVLKRYVWGRGLLNAITFGDVINAVAASEDGRTVLCGSQDGTIGDVVDGTLASSSAANPNGGAIVAICMKRDGSTAAIGRRGGSVFLIEPPASAKLVACSVPDLVALSGAGHGCFVAVATNNRIEIAVPGMEYKLGWIAEDKVSALAWAPDMSILVAAIDKRGPLVLRVSDHSGKLLELD